MYRDYIMCFNSLQVGYKLQVETTYTNKKGMFQFLIGWLQTYMIYVFSEIPNMSFNSLQVGYKPLLSQTGAAFPYHCFNSLQVGYKLNLSNLLCLIYTVSIPYRLATNICYCKDSILVYIRFQFLIGWLQTILLLFIFGFIIGFNSLQVGYKLGFRMETDTIQVVSIPYRLATNKK